MSWRLVWVSGAGYKHLTPVVRSRNPRGREKPPLRMPVRASLLFVAVYYSPCSLQNPSASSGCRSIPPQPACHIPI